MNTQNRLGIWISKPEHLDNIQSILSHYNKDIDDIFIICDESIHHSNYAIISSYYVNFYDIMIAFLDLEDFVINKNHVRSNNITIFCKSSEIIGSKIDKSFFNNVKVIEL